MSLDIKSTEGPYILTQTTQPDQDEYQLHFNITHGTIDRQSTAEQVFKIIAGAVKALPIITSLPDRLTPPEPALSAISDATKLYDTIRTLRKIYTLNPQDAAFLVTSGDPTARDERASGPALEIVFPWLEQRMAEKVPAARAPGYLGRWEVFLRRSVSLIADQGKDTITPGDVLFHPHLGAPHKCIPQGPDCDGKSATIGDRLSSEVKITFDIKLLKETTNEEWIKVFKACRDVGHVTSKYGLSTIDAFLVRWAYVESNLLRSMLEQQGKTWPDFLDIKNPQELCWSADDDNKKLASIANIMKIRLAGQE